MQYFRNTDLANTYHVSIRAVSNWITATKQGRLDLTLHSEKGKDYVANTARNIAIIAKLVEDRRKYRTTKAHKVVTPSPEFYKLFRPEQVVDIISNLEVHREIPRQYNYFDGGADQWDKYSRRLAEEESYNILKATIELLSINQPYIEDLLSKYERVNIVDIGPGNAMPVKAFLGHLLEQNKINKYVPVDISPEMIKIARRNIVKWFKNKIKIEGAIRDITHERIADLLSEHLFDNHKQTVNIILFLGGTIGNFRSPDDSLKTILNSMMSNDILICSKKLDTPLARNYFDFSAQPGSLQLSPNHRLVFDLLNIKDSFYEVHMGFDTERKERFIKIKFKVAISIKFNKDTMTYNVRFNKNDSILVWRSRHQDTFGVLEQFKRVGFELLQATVSRDNEYILNINRVKLASQ